MNQPNPQDYDHDDPALMEAMREHDDRHGHRCESNGDPEPECWFCGAEMEGAR